MEWYWILVIVIVAAAAFLMLSILFYKQVFKRVYDIVFSGLALIVLSPLFIILTVVGTIAMRGNPFFVQPRPGRIDSKTGKERIFNLVKFRTMLDLKDKNGTLLTDDERLTTYGKVLRETSLDELPEFASIFIGDMSFIGPRPLLVKYLNRYNEEQHHRHDVRPGLTGYAQAHGRNALSWEDKFAMDVYYTQHITFIGDLQIIIDTIGTVLKHKGVSSATCATMEEFIGTPGNVISRWEAPK